MLLMLAVMGCDEEESTPSGFTVDASSGDESAGTQSVTFNLGRTAASTLEVEFETTGSASLDGDYTLLTPSPLTVTAGASTATITFRVSDESIIESDETIQFKLTSIDDQALASNDRSTYTYTVTDNDEVPTEGMQVDLTWTLGDGVSIDTADLDLYLAYDVVVEDNEVQSMEVNESIYSANESGFESYLMSKGIKDTEYYVVVVYRKGTVAVPFALGFSDATNGTRKGSGSFTATESGTALFYGPIEKSGNTFSRGKAPGWSTYKFPL